MASVAGYGGDVGIGGGFVRLGHWHSEGVAEELAVLMALAGLASVVLSIAGNVVGMMPKFAHASLLRKRLSVLSVT